jgi:hypothetical protein
MGLPENFVLPGMPYTDPTTADPNLGTDVRMPDGSYRHFPAQFDAAGNPVSPKIFITDSLPGGFAAAMPGTEEYEHYSSVMDRDRNQAIIKMAAIAATAAVAGGFFGAAGSAAAPIAEGADLLQPITVTAQMIGTGAGAVSTAAAGAAAASTVADVMVVTAPALASGAALTAGAVAGTTMLAFPALAGSEASVNALTDDLVNSINTPEMQEAITAGAVPPPPTSLLGSSFTKWGVSTGISQLEKQLGRALSPQEQATVEQQMAAEIQRLQAQMAAQGAANAQLPNGALDQNTVAGMLDSISTNKNIQLALLAGAGILMLVSLN